MNRTEFQRLAITRLREAETLLAAGLWDGAYYLAGYAVECGLKACMLARIGREPELVFSSRKYSDRCWTHDLSVLLEEAGVAPDLDARAATDPAFRQNWATVKAWNESWRYAAAVPEATARKFVTAIADPTYGVLPWICTRW